MAEELEISPQNAEQLHDVLKILVQPTSLKSEIDDRLAAIDRISGSIGQQPVKPESSKYISKEQSEEHISADTEERRYSF